MTQIKEMRDSLYCSTDDGNYDRYDGTYNWRAKSIAIPDLGFFEDQSAGLTTDNGDENATFVDYTRRTSDSKIIGVTYTLRVQKKTTFGESHWRGIGILIRVDMPDGVSVPGYYDFATTTERVQEIFRPDGA